MWLIFLDQVTDYDDGTKRIVWVKVNPDYEILFRLMDGLCPDTERRQWISEYGTDEGICHIGDDLHQIRTKVKIALPVHTILDKSRGVREIKEIR